LPNLVRGEARRGKTVFKKIPVIDPPRGVNRRISEDWLEKNPSGFFDCAPVGTAEGCGEDFRQKIFDCGGVHRSTG